jgi:hypothetical protein
MEDTRRVSRGPSNPIYRNGLPGPNYTRPPPDLIDGEEEYEVESILKSRRYGRGRKVQYLVKWKGYTLGQ